MKQSYLTGHPAYLFLFLAFLVLLLVSCEKDETTPPVVDACENTNYTYTTGIKTLFDTKCATSGCHNGNNTLVDYSAYPSIYNDRVKLRDGINQGLARVTNGRAQLTQQEELKILCWIKDGAPE